MGFKPHLGVDNKLCILNSHHDGINITIGSNPHHDWYNTMRIIHLFLSKYRMMLNGYF